MSMLPVIYSFPIGIILFLFLFWRRLKEDYSSFIVFSASFHIIFGFIAGFLIGKLLLEKIMVSSYLINKEGIWFWTSLLGGFILFLVSVLRYKIKFLEVFESFLIGAITWFFVITFFVSLEKGDLKWLIYSFSIFGLVLGFFVLDKKYRRFNWYKSGKVGFSGFAIAGIFFLIRSAIAIVSPDMLSFLGRLDAIISAIASFICFLVVYTLSQI